MPVQTGRGGYDPSLTIDEQIADVTQKIEKQRQRMLEVPRAALAVLAELEAEQRADIAKAATAENVAALEATIDAQTKAREALARLESQPLQAIDGSTQANALLQRLADLKAITQADVDTHARMRAEESRERAKNPAGTVAQR